ncbi:MAG: DUF3179 domain-containing protein [Deltaproteobacteria bacterium]|nr:DUF3179 domain-containing protein [Deltaproteobacteria bacterium]
MKRRRGLLCSGLAASILLAPAITGLSAGSEEAAAGQGKPGSGDRLNGFVLAKLDVPRAEILQGGPARDSIPRVDDPHFASPAEASWVVPGNPVVGVVLGGEARAYPVHILEYHQVINDEIGGVPVAVTYDPLAGSPAVFLRKVGVGKERVGKKGARTLRFGISGLVYQCNFVLYDLETESLWSQLRGSSIAGSFAGTRLERVPAWQVPLGAWLVRHPESKVLVRPLPRRIDYRYSPFSAYWVSETIPFPVAARDERYHPKEVVLGVEVDGVERAYLGSILTAAGGRIVDELRGRKLRVAYDSESGTFAWEMPEDLRATDAYWFAWKAFHPKTQIWRSGASSPR